MRPDVSFSGSGDDWRLALGACEHHFSAREAEQLVLSMVRALVVRPAPTARRERPPEYPAVVAELCSLLADHVEAMTDRRPDGGSASWMRDMERLLRIDERTPEAVRRAITWVSQDPFWGPNILSPRKLREKWPQLRAAAKRRTVAPNVRQVEIPMEAG